MAASRRDLARSTLTASTSISTEAGTETGSSRS
jgi:hypothetical protein